MDLDQKPAVDFGEFENFVDGHAGTKGVAEEKDSLGVRGGKFLDDEILGEGVTVAVKLIAKAPRFAVAAEAGAPIVFSRVSCAGVSCAPMARERFEGAWCWPAPMSSLIFS